MKLAIVAANGKAGQLITKEAYDRGIDVTAIVRSSNKTVTDQVIQKDLFDLTTDDIAEFDVIIDAFGQPDENKLDEHSKSMKHLGDLVSNSNKRLLIIGRAGSLYADFAQAMVDEAVKAQQIQQRFAVFAK
ncbi:NAD(P)H-binding protein [Staphylococcus equorum]|uniref:NAD(P)H-binding protein n=1 Tax=Staphylococcus equorum TaxID=246432 RepID=A0A9X4L9B4_9STAP|nr:NAD(P)H-binding protein [Staphylococcus equorum]MDG0843252.1 NAD(P)H-binding protein [Staphylococcus equorum]MDG0858861.1 NAD(P)H-binding protein [Staphylococcus equorum]